MSNGRCNRRRRPINRHLADPFRIVGTAIRMWKFDEFDLNVWRVRGCRYDVIRELVVLHRASFKNDVFVKRKPDALSDSTFDLSCSQGGIDYSPTLHS